MGSPSDNSINPKAKELVGNKKALPSSDQLIQNLKSGSRSALSQALTLVESKLDAHRTLAKDLIEKALPLSGQSIRIGITGVPGVGKSTFIEAFGQYLIEQGKKVAVLAIDPSSTKNKGSILGDKTRMNELSQNANAFIRPSPSANSLGGVARKTRESILLCEAAGYDIIIIETVGVGQSETAVKSMVDFFLLLMLSGAGDELQGIKRGIMEMADLLLINKADGDNATLAKRAKGDYKRALHLFPPNSNEWVPQVETCSALENQGMDKAWEVVLKFERQQKLKGYFNQNRQEQAVHWFRESIGDLLYHSFYSSASTKEALSKLEKMVQGGQKEPYSAARELVNLAFNKR